MLLLLTVVLKVGFVDKRFLVVLVDTVVEEVVMETFEAVVTVDGGSKQRSRGKIDSTRVQLCKVASTLAYYRGRSVLCTPDVVFR